VGKYKYYHLSFLPYERQALCTTGHPLSRFKMPDSADQPQQQPELEKQLESGTEPSSEQGIDPSKGNNEGVESEESTLVDWDGPNDPHNPQNWSTTRKWWLVGLVSAATFNMYVYYYHCSNAFDVANHLE
jgi:hypothetical protein